MALDDIVMGGIKKGTHIANLGGLTGSFKATAERIKEGKGPSDRGTFDQDLMRAIIGFNGDVDPEHADFEVLRHLPPEILNPIMNKYLGKAYENAKKGLIGMVKPEYREIIKDLDDGNMRIGLAYQIGAPKNVKKDYAEIKNAHEASKKWKEMADKEDLDAYVAQIQNSVLKEIFEQYIKTEDKKNILKYVKKRAGIEQSRFFINFTDKPEELIQALNNEDTEKINKLLNANKLEDYLTICVEGCEDRESAYESLGINYAVYSAEKERKEANEKTREEYEAGLKAAA